MQRPKPICPLNFFEDGGITKTKFRKSLYRKTAKLHQTLCILPESSTSIIDKANWFDIGRIKMTYSHIKVLSLMLYSQANHFFVPDQSDKQTFDMQFCSKTVFLIKHTGQVFILHITFLKTLRQSLYLKIILISCTNLRPDNSKLNIRQANDKIKRVRIQISLRISTFWRVFAVVVKNQIK